MYINQLVFILGMRLDNTKLKHVFLPFSEVYSWNDKMVVLAELSTSKLASIARWQPELIFPVQVSSPDKHVLAVVFFTPKELTENISNELKVSIDGDRKTFLFLEYVNCNAFNLIREILTIFISSTRPSLCI